MKKGFILLVEDDPNLGMMIQDYLVMTGYKVKLAQDGVQGWEEYKKSDFDICILDVMLPKKDGFALAEDIRKDNPLIPFIFLTAKAMKEDKIKGLKLGADDYITKPFNTEELKLRIEAILKRTKYGRVKTSKEKEEIYHIGEYEFDFSNHSLQYKGTTQTLTRKESELLAYLCNHRNKIISREEILINVWGNDDYFLGRSMDVFISRLRKYLKNDTSISIQNIHGTGFKFITE